MDRHRNFLKNKWNDSFNTLEHMVDEFRRDLEYKYNPSAMRAISVALMYLQTAHMWVNKAIYSNKEKEGDND